MVPGENRSSGAKLGVHGLDLAAALAREPWLTRPAAQVLRDLLFATDPAPLLTELGWDDVTLLGKCTGRRPASAAERAMLDRYGFRRLALG